MWIPQKMWDAGKLWSHLHFSVIEQHAIHLLNGPLSSLVGLKVDKAVPLWAILITNNLGKWKLGMSTQSQHHAFEKPSDSHNQLPSDNV